MINLKESQFCTKMHSSPMEIIQKLLQMQWEQSKLHRPIKKSVVFKVAFDTLMRTVFWFAFIKPIMKKLIKLYYYVDV